MSGENGTRVNEISANELLLRIGFTLDKQTDLVHRRATAARVAPGVVHAKSSRPGRPWVSAAEATTTRAWPAPARIH